MATMKRGEKSLFTIHHDLAYGESGSPPSIPANSTLNFEVEMFDFKEKEKDKWDCSLEERSEKAKEFKESGTVHFKNKVFDLALKDYKEAWDWADTQSDDNKPLE